MSPRKSEEFRKVSGFSVIVKVRSFHNSSKIVEPEPKNLLCA
jgi:hypothetical protein